MHFLNMDLRILKGCTVMVEDIYLFNLSLLYYKQLCHW